MSGLIGIWNLDGRPIERTLLTRLSATLSHRGPDGEGSWIHGALGLACQLFRVTPESLTETQPHVHSSGIALVFDGRLDNREELLAELGPSLEVSAESPDPAFVLAAYRAFGDRFPEHLNGDFALGLFDPSQRQLLLARDALGVRPLYYCRTGATFLFASEIKALLAHPLMSAQPNEEMLASFILGGLRQDDRGTTLFQGVCSVPPAHLAIVTPEKIVTRQYWDFDLARQVRFGSFDEYAQAFRHYFDQAVRRRLRSAGPVAVSLSGGLDSSAVFCAARALRKSASIRPVPVFGVSSTYPVGSAADENPFLSEIERAYDVTVDRVCAWPVKSGPLTGWKEAIRSVEAPLLDPQWRETTALLQRVHRLGARVLLTGHWGDEVLNDQGYLVGFVDDLKLGQVSAHLRELPHWMTEFPPGRVRRRFLEQLISYYGRFVPEVLRPALRRLRGGRLRAAFPWYTGAFWDLAWRLPSSRSHVGDRVTAHALSLYRTVRSSAHVLQREEKNKVVSMHGLEVAFPFLDRDLISFLMAVPGEIYAWKGVPRALLRAAMRGVVPASILERRQKADFSEWTNEGMERDYAQLVQLLQPDGMAVRRGYVSGKGLSEEFGRLNGLAPGDCEVAWSLHAVLRLEVWLQVFFADGARS